MQKKLSTLSDQVGEQLGTIATLRDDLLSYKKLKEIITLVEGGNSFIVPKEFMQDYLRYKDLAAAGKLDRDGDVTLPIKIDIVHFFEKLIADYEKQANKKILKLCYELPTRPGRHNITLEYYKTNGK